MKKKGENTITLYLCEGCWHLVGDSECDSHEKNGRGERGMGEWGG